jgi:hypothetical protein
VVFTEGFIFRRGPPPTFLPVCSKRPLSVPALNIFSTRERSSDIVAETCLDDSSDTGALPQLSSLAFTATSKSRGSLEAHGVTPRKMALIKILLHGKNSHNSNPQT